MIVFQVPGTGTCDADTANRPGGTGESRPGGAAHQKKDSGMLVFVDDRDLEIEEEIQQGETDMCHAPGVKTVPWSEPPRPGNATVLEWIAAHGWDLTCLTETANDQTDKTEESE